MRCSSVSATLSRIDTIDVYVSKKFVYDYNSGEQINIPKATELYWLTTGKSGRRIFSYIELKLLDTPEGVNHPVTEDVNIIPAVFKTEAWFCL